MHNEWCCKRQFQMFNICVARIERIFFIERHLTWQDAYHMKWVNPLVTGNTLMCKWRFAEVKHVQSTFNNRLHYIIQYICIYIYVHCHKNHLLPKDYWMSSDLVVICYDMLLISSFFTWSFPPVFRQVLFERFVCLS